MVRPTPPGCNFAFLERTDVSSFLSTGKYSAKSCPLKEREATSQHFVVVLPPLEIAISASSGCAPAAVQDRHRPKDPCACSPNRNARR